MDQELAHRIARYLFLHKWLSSPWSPGNELLLVAAITEGASSPLLDPPEEES